MSTVDKVLKELISDCLNKKENTNRTDIKTKSCFGKSVKISCLGNKLAMTTLKKVNPKNVITELLWMLVGNTNVQNLINKGCNIWNGNSTKEFLENRGLLYEERVIGPGYGFQWRSSGGIYDETGKRTESGFDQIKDIIENLLNNPSSRRIVLNSWIPNDISKMALPPCHMMMQFNVEDKYLDLQVYQRSADIFLGVPYNYTSYSILLCLFSQLCGYLPRNLIFAYGNYHIYENHIEQCKELLNRNTKKYGILCFSDKIVTTPRNTESILNLFDNLTYEDFIIENYESHPFLYGKMAV